MNYLLSGAIISAVTCVVFVFVLLRTNRDFKSAVETKESNSIKYYKKQMSLTDVEVASRMKNCIEIADGGFSREMLIQYPKDLLLDKEGRLA